MWWLFDPIAMFFISIWSVDARMYRRLFLATISLIPFHHSVSMSIVRAWVHMCVIILIMSTLGGR